MSHIAIDMDDVVVDFVGGVIQAVNTEHGTNLVRTDVNKWELNDLLNPILGGPWWDWLKQEEWLWANFGTIPGAIGGIRLLRKEGHYIELVTSKPEWAEHNVWKWLGKWRPAVQAVTIVPPKANKAHHTEADWLIDDKPQNCQDFYEDGRATMLFSQPHNLDAKIVNEPRFRRVNNWREIVWLFTEGLSSEQ